jgi:hypothetical protein
MRTQEQFQPIACTLTTGELATRGARWRALAAVLARSRQLDDGLRLAFRPEPGVEAELRELAALEADCCAFADWRVHADECCVMIDITAKDDAGIAAVQGMLSSLRSARFAL